jgi:hypothetical protein
MLLETLLASSGYLGVEYLLYRNAKYELLQGRPSYTGDRMLETDDYKEFIRLYSKKFKYHAPILIGPHVGGLGVGVPIGGELEESWEPVYTNAISENEDARAMNYAQIPDLDYEATVTQYINSPESLKTMFDLCKIPHAEFPVTLPMKLSLIKLPPSTPVYMSTQYKICGRNQLQVAQLMAKKPALQRAPFLKLAGILAVGSAIGLAAK